MGDVSHIVGETIDDHASHRRGVDVDLYVLGYPAGASFPEAYLCSGSASPFTLERLRPPSDEKGSYKEAGRTRLDAASERAVFTRFATVIAYCIATWPRLDTLAWHGVAGVEEEAAEIARRAFDGGWRAAWGQGPARRGDIAPREMWSRRRSKLVGQGSKSYDVTGGWPLHQDHLHIRLVG